MANPTTNYGWQMPTPTDLVTDLPADFGVFGQAVDSTVFANAAAGLSATIVDAKGDLIAATAADAVSRLAVGANNTILTADSTTATGLKWAASASGMTLIKRASYSAVANTGTTFDGVFTSAYKNYIMTVDNANASTSNYLNLNWRVSGATNSDATYDFSSMLMSNASPAVWLELVRGSSQTTASMMDHSASTTRFSNATFNIFNVGNISTSPDIYGNFRSAQNARCGFSWGRSSSLILADGLILTASTGTISGTVSIYGLAI